MQAEKPQLVIEDHDPVTIVRFQEAIIVDPSGIERIAERLNELVDRQRRQKLVLDFTYVELLASQMLGVLLIVQGKTRAAKGDAVLCAMRERLKKIFTVTSLDKKFTFCPDEAAALTYFESV